MDNAITSGKQVWQQHLTTWNQDYFVPALTKAKTIVTSASSQTPSVERKYETSKTHCPGCKSLMSKIPSNKVKKKYFLKCTSGCENVVLFWSDRTQSWQAPPNQESEQKSPAKMTSHLCPVCKQPLKEYNYTEEGQTKTMLRCSLPQSRQDKKRRDVVYFST